MGKVIPMGAAKVANARRERFDQAAQDSELYAALLPMAAERARERGLHDVADKLEHVMKSTPSASWGLVARYLALGV